MSLTNISTQEAIYFLETLQDEVEKEPQYDSFTEKLVDNLNEQELGMCLFKLNKCTCCLKHTSQEPGFINNCECKCRHYRRWIYRALATYSGKQLVIQKHHTENPECIEPGAYEPEAYEPEAYEKAEHSSDDLLDYEDVVDDLPDYEDVDDDLPDYEDVVDAYRDTYLNIDNLEHGYWV